MTIGDAKKLIAQGHIAAAKDLLIDLDHAGQSTAELAAEHFRRAPRLSLTA